jgi:hypothetical protein
VLQRRREIDPTAIGVPDIRHRKFAPRESFVPLFAATASFGFPTFTVK